MLFSIPDAHAAIAAVLAWIASFTLVDILECLGSISALCGAWLLALRCRYSKFGWCAYLVANGFLLGFALDIDRYWLTAQYVGFTLSSLLGVWNYVLVDRYPNLPLVDLDWLRGAILKQPGLCKTRNKQ